MKYGEWLDKWMRLYVKPAVKDKTYRNYVDIIRLYVKPKVGEYEMNELDGVVLQQFVISLFESGNATTGEGLAVSTILQTVSVVERSLMQAVKVGYAKMTFDGITCPRNDEKRGGEVKCFTLKEQRKMESYIFGAADVRLYGVLLTLYTGIRIGELMSLTWSDVDFQKGLLSVSKTCRDSWTNGYKKIVGTPKTVSSYRVIPIPKQILPYMRLLKRQSNGKYVISGKCNDVSVRSYQRTFERLLKRLNIPHRSFHSLRHTFATRAIENNIDIKTLSEVMGHKSPAITLSIYAHSLAPHKKLMMNKLGKILMGGFYYVDED